MDSKLEKRKMPKFELNADQKDNLETFSAVSKMLAEDPTIGKEIADIFNEVTKAKEKELIDRVSQLISEKVRNVKLDSVKAVFPFWFIFYLPPEKVESMMESEWIPLWVPH